MTADADVALVMAAIGAELGTLGHWWKRGQWFAPHPFDANFVVEVVIPWAVAQGFWVTIQSGGPYGLQFSADVAPVVGDGQGAAFEAPTMPEAVFGALAAALRTGGES